MDQRHSSYSITFRVLTLVCLFTWNGFVPSTVAQELPELISVTKIWDQAPHNAFTDLVRFNDKWFCTFREGEHHVYGEDGKIRVITSDDGKQWKSAALLEENGVDLRDPKLTVTPDGRLMLVMGGSVYEDRTLISRQPRVSFSSDGSTWTPLEAILETGDWLWRVTWHNRQAYGATYRATADTLWQLALVRSEDGVRWDQVTRLDLHGKPNETTLRFLPDGEMVALVRREGGDRNAWIGTSLPPYTDWAWDDAGHFIGGPNFIILPDDSMWAAGRNPDGPTTSLGKLTRDTYQPLLTLPSGGDTSYPGLVWHNGILWISYYSSHEGKTSIYLARVKLP